MNSLIGILLRKPPGGVAAFSFREALGLVVLLGTCLAASASTVVSSLPAMTKPGEALSVTNTVSPDPEVFIYAVQDAPPAGWAVINISDGGTLDGANHTIKWGPFMDNQPRALSYRVIPSPTASGVVTFAGVAMFNILETVAITGQRSTFIEGVSTNSVFSTMPATFTPGSNFVVSCAVTLAPGVMAVAVEDQLPSGWGATNISDSGIFDRLTRKVKWGPFFDGSPRTLRYVALPPSNALTAVTFSGTGYFDATQVQIGGQRESVPIVVSHGEVICSFPSEFHPGQWLTVTNTAIPASSTLAFAVEDQPPANWIVTNVSHGGSFDSLNHKVRWGPFFNEGSLILTYSVLPPADALGVATYIGTGSFDQVIVPISGQRQATAAEAAYGEASSSFNSLYAPGVTFIVTNLITPVPDITAYAVTDLPPPGWILSQISHGGTVDPETRAVKWGPFIDSQPRVLTYAVTPPSSAAGVATFVGEVLFDKILVPISGQREAIRLLTFPVGNVIRVLPSTYSSNTSFTVIDFATPLEKTSVYAVQDGIPAGWLATNISDGGSFDATTSEVKWGPFFDDLPRSLNFQAIPPANPSEIALFEGMATFDNDSARILGEWKVSLGNPVIVPLRIHNPIQQGNGQFLFEFTNLTSQAVTVLASTNCALPLSKWETLPPPVAVAPKLFRVHDTNAQNSSRYYLLRSP